MGFLSFFSKFSRVCSESSHFEFAACFFRMFLCLLMLKLVSESLRYIQHINYMGKAFRKRFCLAGEVFSLFVCGGLWLFDKGSRVGFGVFEDFMGFYGEVFSDSFEYAAGNGV